MAKTYVIGRISVKDTELWARYRREVGATLAPWGGELLLRGHAVASLSGAEPHGDIVALRFPDVRSARGWFTSPAYQALIELRSRAADVVLTLYED